MHTLTRIICVDTKGTFLALMGNKAFMDMFGQNLNWFCVDSDSRKRILVNIHAQGDMNSNQEALVCRNSCEFNTIMQSVFNERNLDSFLCNLLRVARLHICSKQVEHDDKHVGNRSTSIHNINVIEAYMLKGDQFTWLLEKTFSFIRKASRDEIMILFGKFIKVSKDYSSRINGECGDNVDDTDFSSDKMAEISSFFGQVVVLVDRISNDNEWDLREWIVQEFCNIICYSGNAPLFSVVFFGNNERTESFTSSLNTRPRRDLASAISNPNCDNLMDEFMIDAKVAFNVFDSRLIPVEEWFRRFNQCRTTDKKEKVITGDLLQRFAFCVYQFMICGLVVRSRRNENVFEKAALVWATVNTGR